MRRALGVVVTMLAVGIALAGYAVPASAAIGDRVRSMAIAYEVGADGVLHVTETIEYHFGDTDRHGIFRDLVVREPYADNATKDQRYDVTNVQVSSPTAPDEFDLSTTKTNKARDQVLRIKIGSSGDSVPGQDATYRISYDVRGALRHFPDHSELYWDATGSSWEASLDHVTVTVTVPQGVTRVACYEGPPGSTESCNEKSIVGGKAVFTQETDVVRGEQLTVVVGLKPGAVSNDLPIVVDPPGFLARYGVSWPAAIVSLALTALAIVGGKILVRSRSDRRYDGMPPGTVPPEGRTARTVPDRVADKEIPVAFTPPNITAAEGGLLLDGTVDTSEVAATLVDLAVRGAVRIEGENDVRTAVLVDAGIAEATHEKALLKGLFPKQEPGGEVRLVAPAVGDTRPQRAAERMGEALWKRAAERNWYLRMPRRPKVVASSGYGWVPFGCGVFLAVLVGLVGLVVSTVKFGAPSWLGPTIVVVLPVLALLNALIDLFLHNRKGRRDARGRALTDQVIGFRQYLTTAEADQLRFEDGEDIFSKYLPWALVLGLADRWQQICRQLVDSGRLTAAPSWYSGSSSYYDSGWTAGSISTTVSSTFAAPPTPSTGGGSSSGFSSSSSSSSSSGGGGGGGGGGSW
ncbi:DUF2207 domain-containing protein [Kribbella sindirgiensis]|uniref:DUF2207 domain-containing protein n=1 Tax=Kribbella sindirgiensis TaxID=1124744 RepID=A0A4R0IH61_9ACTN|nr:DUF2207 domain-containing protein [Kribbella sindirgiensis]TCC30546.1 DUF2207 domain-containing protein [Kribbella sindirgiensis]